MSSSKESAKIWAAYQKKESRQKQPIDSGQLSHDLISLLVFPTPTLAAYGRAPVLVHPGWARGAGRTQSPMWAPPRRTEGHLAGPRRPAHRWCSKHSVTRLVARPAPGEPQGGLTSAHPSETGYRDATGPRGGTGGTAPRELQMAPGLLWYKRGVKAKPLHLSSSLSSPE
ncbi:unnamed protein product [Arctogadus glacialis]